MVATEEPSELEDDEDDFEEDKDPDEGEEGYGDTEEVETGVVVSRIES